MNGQLEPEVEHGGIRNVCELVSLDLLNRTGEITSQEMRDRALDDDGSPEATARIKDIRMDPAHCGTCALMAGFLAEVVEANGGRLP